MAATEHRECYGKMFPNVSNFPLDQRIEGEAFWFECKTAGRMPFGSRTVGIGADGWDKCRSCPEFEHCYKLCMGRITLAIAIGAK